MRRPGGLRCVVSGRPSKRPGPRWGALPPPSSRRMGCGGAASDREAKGSRRRSKPLARFRSSTGTPGQLRAAFRCAAFWTWNLSHGSLSSLAAPQLVSPISCQWQNKRENISQDGIWRILESSNLRVGENTKSKGRQIAGIPLRWEKPYRCQAKSSGAFSEGTIQRLRYHVGTDGLYNGTTTHTHIHTQIKMHQPPPPKGGGLLQVHPILKGFLKEK